VSESDWKYIAWKPTKASGRIGASSPIHLVRLANRSLLGEIYTACGVEIPSDIGALRDWAPDPGKHRACRRCRKVVYPVSPA